MNRIDNCKSLLSSLFQREAAPLFEEQVENDWARAAELFSDRKN
jgi:hypothetical protein